MAKIDPTDERSLTVPDDPHAVDNGTFFTPAEWNAWITDRLAPKPQDRENHAFDAARYMGGLKGVWPRRLTPEHIAAMQNKQLRNVLEWKRERECYPYPQPGTPRPPYFIFEELSRLLPDKTALIDELAASITKLMGIVAEEAIRFKRNVPFPAYDPAAPGPHLRSPRQEHRILQAAPGRPGVDLKPDQAAKREANRQLEDEMVTLLDNLTDTQQAVLYHLQNKRGMTLAKAEEIRRKAGL